MCLAGGGDHEHDLERDQHAADWYTRAPARGPVPPSSRGLGRHPFKVEIAGSNPLGVPPSVRPARLAILARVELMGVTIRTIVNDNVAIRCDGCREIIPGTPWRVNLLDIVAPEVAVGWDEATPINPGPHQFHSDEPASAAGWPSAATTSAGAATSARSCARSPCRSTRPRGACATASTATSTSSSPPDGGRAVRRPPTSRAVDAHPASYTRRLRACRAYLDLPRFCDQSDRPPGAVSGVPRVRRPARAPTARSRERLAARRGEPAPRRRPRHPPSLGRRGPRAGVHDARRAPPVRATRAGAARRQPAHRPVGRAGRPRRDARPPERGLPPALRRAARRRPGPADVSSPSSERESLPRARAAGSSTRSCATSTSRGRRASLAEREAVDARPTQLGERLADHGVPMSDAVSMFVAARRPFLAELSVVARRRGVDAAPDRPAVRRRRPGSSTGCCSRSSPRTPRCPASRSGDGAPGGRGRRRPHVTALLPDADLGPRVPVRA